jgi:hypothetical protein
MGAKRYPTRGNLSCFLNLFLSTLEKVSIKIFFYKEKQKIFKYNPSQFFSGITRILGARSTPGEAFLKKNYIGFKYYIHEFY